MSSVAQSGKLKGESANTLELRTSKREYREGEGTVKRMKKIGNNKFNRKKGHPQKMGKCVAHVDVALKGHATKLLSP